MATKAKTAPKAASPKKTASAKKAAPKTDGAKKALTAKQPKPAAKAAAKASAAKPQAKAKPAAKTASRPAAKPAAKQTAKPAPKPAAKKAPAKQESAAKPAAKPKQPPKIAKKPAPAKQPASMDAAKAVSFAMAIAEEMKRSAKNEDARRSENEIKLSRRPTTRAQGQKTEQFPEEDLREFRRRLIEAREKAMSGAIAMRATGFNESEDREADGGDGTNQTLRLQALGQVGAINRTIQQIEEALHRIDDGSYGVCTVCGQLIRKPRLLNQPFVLTCMECQSDMERRAGR